MSTVNQHQMLFRKFQQQQQLSQQRSGSRMRAQQNNLINSGRGLGSLTATEIDDAAAAMGVPSIWIDRPVGINWEFSKNNNNNTAESTSPNRQQQQHQSSVRRRNFYPENVEEASLSPVRSIFEDASVTGAALRLHSFVHSDEEPDVKSSRLYQAYVSMDRTIPKETTTTTTVDKKDTSETQSSPPPPRNNNASNKNISNNKATFPSSDLSPLSSSSLSPPSKGKNQLHQQQHDRFVRKLSHEAQAPSGIEVTRMLRFLAATEAMNRGALEQEAQGSLHSNLANYRYGLLHSKGISSDRGTNQSKVFLDN